VQQVIKAEEEAFNNTLDLGTQLEKEAADFSNHVHELAKEARKILDQNKAGTEYSFKGEVGTMWKSIRPLRDLAEKFGSPQQRRFIYNAIAFSSSVDQGRIIRPISPAFHNVASPSETIQELEASIAALEKCEKVLPGETAFLLYDTYGFPLDLTELMARERGFTVDTARFEKLMEEQRARARAAQKKEIIAASNVDTSHPTRFVGFDRLSANSTVLEVVNVKDKLALTLDISPMYAEMGGQVGDTGEAQSGGKVWHIVNTQKTGNSFLHFLADKDAPEPGSAIELRVNAARRGAIQRHHSVTHLLHWALHEVASPDATQKGSYVGPEKLTFDFSSAPLTPAQVSNVEKLVNERILENAGVTWSEVPYADVKGRKDIMQFFGEKYGDLVRVVQIGGKPGALDGYSMELCGGTHTRATGEIGLFRIVSESAVAAGIRRIEAVAGLRAYEKARDEAALISTVAGKMNTPILDLEKKVDSLLAQQKDLEKQLRASRQKQAAETARGLRVKVNPTGDMSNYEGEGKPWGLVPFIVENLGAVDGEFLQSTADALKAQFKGVVVLAGTANGAVSLNVAVSPEFTSKFQAGKIIQTIAPIIGGKGGGKPDNARGGGKDVSKIEEALQKARELLKV
jgi:alanyl-tRNA synthetase